jgi:hypothetical protein
MTLTGSGRMRVRRQKLRTSTLQPVSAKRIRSPRRRKRYGEWGAFKLW